MTVKIKNLLPGESAVIAGYEQGNSYYRQKLLSMGLIKGTVITLLKTAPFGDPVQLELRGFKLSLRKTEADVLILEKTVSVSGYPKGFFGRMRHRMGFSHGGRHGNPGTGNDGTSHAGLHSGRRGRNRKDSCCA